MTRYEVSRLTDKDPIRAYLNRDRSLTAYALGDLDDAFWPESTFYGAWAGDDLAALALFYAGLEPVVLTVFGAPDGVRAILAAQALPEEIYYLALPEAGPVLAEFYDLAHNHREWRMVLDHACFDAVPGDCVARLGPEHADALAALYQHAAEPGETVVAFSPWQIAHGCFYGVWHGGALVATAGTHVWSQAERVAAIGNVFTQPEYRGHGYATHCTAAVATDAIAAGLETIVLNVRDDNGPALHVYEKLGFRRYAVFLEGPALRRESR